MPLNDNRWGRHLDPLPGKSGQTPAAGEDEKKGEGARDAAPAKEPAREHPAARPESKTPSGESRRRSKPRTRSKDASENAKDLEAAWQSFNDMLKGYRKAEGGESGPNRGPVPMPPVRPQGVKHLAASLALIALFSAGAYLGAGFYTVPSGEVAALYSMGEYSKTVGVGTHWHFPWPFEKIRRVDTRLVHRSEAVFSGAGQEGYLPTADGRLVRASAAVQWQVSEEGVRDYLENVSNPSQAVGAALKRALRETFSGMTLKDALGGRPAMLAGDAAAQVQAEADSLSLGIKVLSVEMENVRLPAEAEDAARAPSEVRGEDAAALREARRWAAMVDTVSAGTARQIREEAESYRERVVHAAESDSGRLAFLQSREASSDERKEALRRTWSSAMQAALPNAGELSELPASDIMGAIRVKRPGDGTANATGSQAAVTAADVEAARRLAASDKKSEAGASKAQTRTAGAVQEDRDNTPDRSEYLRNKGR